MALQETRGAELSRHLHKAILEYIQYNRICCAVMNGLFFLLVKET